jgi:hypothetical protein
VCTADYPKISAASQGSDARGYSGRHDADAEFVDSTIGAHCEGASERAAG